MGVEKSAEAIVVAARWRRAESAVRSRTWIAQTTGKKSKAGDRGNLATKGGEVECRDMGARCQSGCDEKRTREHAERTALNCGNREVPATGTLRGVGGEAFLPYPISPDAVCLVDLWYNILRRIIPGGIISEVEDEVLGSNG